jgi:drug/metabolite transporter superfamily protein YnfA
MVAQAFVLHHALRTRRPSRAAWMLVAALVVVDLVLDYVPGVSNHPFLPDGPHTFGSVVGAFTTVLVAATLAWAWWLYRPAFSSSDESGE